MAEIFLAQLQGAQGFQKLVVLKRIRRSFSADPQFRRMLVGEAHVAMGLNHGNIVQVLDLGEAGGRDFLALELVDGWSLDQLLKRGQAADLPLPRALGLHIALQVCRALAYAHGKTLDGEPQHIVHRDVSPQNILVSEHGEVKLTDFGIAKARNRKEKTEKGVVKGKISFMSPEQAQGEELDARSDLFSLGTVLYLMATGRHPFLASTDLETMVRIQAAEFVPPHKVRPRVEPELCRLIERAMAKKPSARFDSAQEMLSEVEAALRAAFQPAGQSELKRWLDQLQRADGVPPISQQPSRGRGAETEAESFAEEVELSDSDLVPVEAPRAPVTPRPPPFTHLSQPPTVAPPAAVSTSGRPSTRTLGAFAALLAVGAGAWIALHQRGTNPASTARDAGTGLSAARTTAAPAPRPSVDPVAVRAVDAGLPDAGSGVTRAVSVTDAGATGDAGAALSVAPDAGPFADALAVAEADGGGSEEDVQSESEPAPAPDAGASEAPRTAPAHPTAGSSAGSAAPHPPGMVSILITSEPPGASVRLEKRVFGKTPIHLRFQPGLTFALAFSLDGYAPQTRTFTAKDRAGAHVHVVLHRGTAHGAFSPASSPKGHR